MIFQEVRNTAGRLQLRQVAEQTVYIALEHGNVTLEITPRAPWDVSGQVKSYFCLI